MITSKKERVFQTINNSVFLLVSLTMIAPLIHLLAVSLSSAIYVNTKRVTFWPKGFNLTAYEQILQLPAIWKAMGVSIWITVAGTLLTLALSASLSYALSRKAMKGRKYILQAIVFTFIFTVPLIPGYLLVRSLGMENTLWALMIPGATGAFYILIMRTFFQGISSELFESAKLDGCSEWRIFYSIVIPLSKPVLATVALFHAVSQWNGYFSAMIYIRSKDLQPLQILLRNLVVEDEAQSMLNVSSTEVMRTATPEMMKAAVILFATLPIIIVYPFLQRFFVKGAMIGAVKE